MVKSMDSQNTTVKMQFKADLSSMQIPKTVADC